MKVLEKIKRCVSLVWDFQEIYGEEDIEDFCRNELHTYPQHNEILDYFKRIEELEKENTELKKQLEMSNKVYNDNLDYSHHIEGQLAKAIEILKKYHNECPSKYSFEDIDDMAEQFLSEVENEKHQRKDV